MAYKRFRIVFQHKMSDERFLNISVSLQFMDCNLNNVHLKVDFSHAGTACVPFISLPYHIKRYINIKPLFTKIV